MVMNIELEDVTKFLSIVQNYLEDLGLKKEKDFMMELSEWVDEEIEDWRKPQIVVKLYESGLRKINDKRLDEFKLLENILKNISDHVSQNFLRNILISIEVQI